MTDSTTLRVCESITGLYNYHIHHAGEITSLCGTRVMHTSVPLSAWGVKSHIPDHWCAKCKALAEKEGQK